MNYWDQRAIKRILKTEQITKKHQKEIRDIYNDAYRDVQLRIDNIYKNYSKDTGLDTQELRKKLSKYETEKHFKQLKKKVPEYVKENYKARITEADRIQNEIYAEAKQIYKAETVLNTKNYTDIIKYNYKQTIADTTKKIIGKPIYADITNNQILSLLHDNWSGKNYSSRIWNNTDLLAERLKNIVGRGMATGESVQKMSQQIREQFNVAKYKSDRIIRTELNHFYNESDAVANEELGIKEYVFVATLDSRTSEVCRSHDGNRYKYKDKQTGVNYPPLHPNCRSVTRGYIKEEIEKTITRRARDIETGETYITDAKNYDEYIKEQEWKYEQKDDIIDYKDVDFALKEQLEKQKDELYHNKIITIEEQNAIYKYTMDSKEININLNEVGFENIANEALLEQVNHLDLALDKFELKENVRLYRGTNAKRYEKYNVGDIFPQQNYVSTSVDKNKAVIFASQREDKAVIEVLVPKGKRGLYIGNKAYYNDEEEFLLKRGTEFKVLKKEKTEGILNLVLEVIDER